jgi:hypothetical protein
MIRTKPYLRASEIIWDYANREKVMDFAGEEHFTVVGCDPYSQKHFQATAIYIGGEFSHLQDIQEA